MKPLTKADWRKIVAGIFRPAYRSQWVDKLSDEEFDYCGSELIRDDWSAEKAEWAARQCCRMFRRLDQPLAMLSQAAEGQFRDGQRCGGWEQSRAYYQICADDQRTRDVRDCAAAVSDGFRRLVDCGRFQRCESCDKRPLRRSGRKDDDSFQTVGEIKLPPMAGQEKA